MEQYLNEFGHWLERLGYARATVYSYAKLMEVFSRWMNEQKLSLKKLEQNDLENYRHHLEHRAKRKRNGSLCIATIRGHLQVITTFGVYLQQYRQLTIPSPDLSAVPLHQHIKEPFAVLTQQEIKKLYQATDNSLYGIRDRAMLALYYGCGLRRNEGLNLKAEDIDWRRRCLHVIGGKGNKDRVVPISHKALEDMRDYDHIRKTFAPTGTGYFLLSTQQHNKGTMSGQTILERIKKLSEAAGIKKEMTVHSLRHSIATHLLQQGMGLDGIRQFLGHSSLETTQKYVHIKMLIEQEEFEQAQMENKKENREQNGNSNNNEHNRDYG
jgi:integrase/recombinase XerD